MRQKLITIFVTALWILSVNAQNGKQPNVIMLVVDDLRPELGCYGNTTVISPNIDKIASKGLVFNHTYCQTAICMPSRVSVLSGFRPESMKRPNRIIHPDVPSCVISLPRLFKNEGYSTVSIGKIFHYNDDAPEDWTRKYTDTFNDGEEFHGYCSGYQLESNRNILANYRVRFNSENSKLPRPGSIEVTDTPEHLYPDAVIAERAIEELRKFKKEKEPFFLALGFYRPHLPFSVPQKYWDMYKAEDIKPPKNQQKVIDGVTQYTWNELRRYGDIPNKGTISDKKAEI